MTSDRFHQALARFDEANCDDPHRVLVNGVSEPAEFVYGVRMTDRLSRFEPAAPEIVQLAARCQHIRRWMIPRETYPMDRAGYRRWRTDLSVFHAEQAGEILAETGYDSATIGRVQSLLRKENLKSDPEMQLLEDVICLVFLEHYFMEFALKQEEAKVIKILQRTWQKMSKRGHAAALQLSLEPEARRLIEKALQG